jgi:acyl-CoA thioester hydrolase
VGIVFHGNYFTYMDVGRVDYLRNLDLMEQGRPIKGFDNVVVNSTCDFHQPARYDDPIVIHVRVAEMGETSFRFQFLFTHRKTGNTLASGGSTHVAIDMDSLRPIPVPDSFRQILESFEKRDLTNSL